MAAWWLMKLTEEERAPGTRLALFWHVHFACTASKVQDPQSLLAARLQLAARLLRADAGPPVIWCALSGFDTHAALLAQLGEATAAFLGDLRRDGTQRPFLTLVYSEFGRRVAENGSAGTDHGAAAPMFALGPVRGGLHGLPPDLADLDDADVRARADFRAVFAEAAVWMGWDAAGLFDGRVPGGKSAPGYLR